VRDIRLDPGLQRDCKEDIRIHLCSRFEVRRAACQDSLCIRDKFGVPGVWDIPFGIW
jgi:hypothetical protein